MTTVQTPQFFCRAGAARGDITPPIGAYHRMWGAATHDRSMGVHRPLTATVLLVGAADAAAAPRMAVVALDHCILGDEDVQSIQRRIGAAASVTPGCVQVCLSHTHGAGLMSRDRVSLPGGDLIAPYLQAMVEMVGKLAAEAIAAMTPAWIVYGRGQCNLAANRDYFDAIGGQHVCGFNPSAPADDTLIVARIMEAQQGNTLATIVNYACHPTTLAWANTLVSPDYVGAMREVIEAATDGAPCLFLQGASGELGPRDGFVGDAAVADRNGRWLGHAAVSALESLPPPGTKLQYQGPVVSGAVLGTWAHVPLDDSSTVRSPPWRYRAWTIDVRYRNGLPALDAVRAERANLAAQVDAVQEKSDPGALHDLRARIEQADRQIMRLAALPPGHAFPLPVSAWFDGGAAWVCVAGEHYSLLQTTLRDRFPNVPVIVATIANGWQPGYLVPLETYGKGIYQETISMVAPGSLEKVIHEIGDQLSEWLGTSV